MSPHPSLTCCENVKQRFDLSLECSSSPGGVSTSEVWLFPSSTNAPGVRGDSAVCRRAPLDQETVDSILPTMELFARSVIPQFAPD